MDRTRKATINRYIGMILVLTLGLAMLGLLSSCGSDSSKSEQDSESYEIALITASPIDDGSFIKSTWDSIEAFAQEYELTCKYYKAEDESNEACNKAIQEAKDNGAALVFFAGSQYETVVHSAQKEFKDIDFVLIDGVPRDEDYNYEMSKNSTGVLFAEEEAGYLAGYAAVSDGYTKLGFMGGRDLPPVKRYGFGFLQGVAAAAEDMDLKDVQVRYCYTDTFEAADWIREGASKWYSDGTQVIFACGGGIGNSVIEAAEKSNGKVIGVDIDQSALSETVITSAKKELHTAVYDILKTYIHDNYKGNSIFNYTIDNNGIALEMTNARFNKFNNGDYKDLLGHIGKGELKISKEMGDRDLKELAADNIKVEEVEMKKEEQ